MAARPGGLLLYTDTIPQDTGRGVEARRMHPSGNLSRSVAALTRDNDADFFQRRMHWPDFRSKGPGLPVSSSAMPPGDLGQLPRAHYGGPSTSPIPLGDEGSHPCSG